jgi:CheY-specific phosphatase CheX
MNPAKVQVPSNPWLDAARVAICDIARQALGAPAEILGPAPMFEGLAGSIIPIMSNLSPVQIGLFSDDMGCEGLARALLGSSPGETLTRAEVVDAIGEIVNMFSGSVKARVARYATHAALGLPTFVHGPIETIAQQVVEAIKVRIGTVDAYIVVVHTGE